MSEDNAKRSSYLLLYTILANGTIRILLSYQPYISYFFGTQSKARRDSRGRRGQKLWCAGKWCVPGGAIEGSETCRQAAVREFREESGIDLNLMHLPDENYTQHNFQPFDAVFVRVTEEQLLGVYNGITTCINERAQVALLLDQQNGDNNALATLRTQFPNCPWGDECENINLLDLPSDEDQRNQLLHAIFNDPNRQDWFIQIIRYLAGLHGKPEKKNASEQLTKPKKQKQASENDLIFVNPVFTDGAERFIWFKGTISYYWYVGDDTQRFVFKDGVIDDSCATNDEYLITNYTQVQRDAKGIDDGIRSALNIFIGCDNLPKYKPIDIKNDIIPSIEDEQDCVVFVKLDQKSFDQFYSNLLAQIKVYVQARRKIMSGEIDSYDDLMDKFPNLPLIDYTNNIYYIDVKDDGYPEWISRLKASSGYWQYAQAVTKYFPPPKE